MSLFPSGVTAPNQGSVRKEKGKFLVSEQAKKEHVKNAKGILKIFLSLDKF